MVAFAPNLESFEKILSLCKEHNIKIHVYTAPIWKGLVKNLVNRQEFINANIAPLINKYRASYVDQTANPISENAAYFADDTHLNTEGLKDWMKFLEQMEH